MVFLSNFNAVNTTCVSFCILSLFPIKMFFLCSVKFCDIKIFMNGDANLTHKSPLTVHIEKAKFSLSLAAT